LWRWASSRTTHLARGHAHRALRDDDVALEGAGAVGVVGEQAVGADDDLLLAVAALGPRRGRGGGGCEEDGGERISASASAGRWR
jgi:hypothetical protein